MSARPPMLFVTEIGTTIDTDGRSWATASIDVSDHPEIADLARVHAIDGIGDIRTTARRVPGAAADMVLLGIQMTTPVQASFALAFVLPAHRDFLRDAFAAGAMAIATTDPKSASGDQPLWLAIDLDPEAAAAVLD